MPPVYEFLCPWSVSHFCTPSCLPVLSLYDRGDRDICSSISFAKEILAKLPETGDIWQIRSPGGRSKKIREKFVRWLPTVFAMAMYTAYTLAKINECLRKQLCGGTYNPSSYANFTLQQHGNKIDTATFKDCYRNGYSSKC
uniref:Uncharacterized protein n=1 Tax=Photinus pyralis TaxID=7054 RepID=A0A1Y1K2P1_PHOPY